MNITNPYNLKCKDCIKASQTWRGNMRCDPCQNEHLKLLNERRISKGLSVIIQPERSKREDIQKKCEHCPLCPDTEFEGKCCRSHLHE
jgi:hypothetical protein